MCQYTRNNVYILLLHSEIFQEQSTKKKVKKVEYAGDFVYNIKEKLICKKTKDLIDTIQAGKCLNQKSYCRTNWHKNEIKLDKDITSVFYNTQKV